MKDNDIAFKKKINQAGQIFSFPIALGLLG
jgi:hypothetical protein